MLHTPCVISIYLLQLAMNYSVGNMFALKNAASLDSLLGRIRFLVLLTLHIILFPE